MMVSPLYLFVAARKIVSVGLGTRPGDSFVADEDVKKTTNQPNVRDAPYNRSEGLLR